MPHLSSYRPDPAEYSPDPPTSDEITRDELLDALSRARRHGRIDLARRIESRLVGFNQTIRTYDLATAWIGGAR